jgi:hypothetical protein
LLLETPVKPLVFYMHFDRFCRTPGSVPEKLGTDPSGSPAICNLEGSKRQDGTRRPPAQNAHCDALTRAGRPPGWYYVDNEWHGFYDTDNQAEVYRRLEAFLAKQIGK